MRDEDMIRDIEDAWRKTGAGWPLPTFTLPKPGQTQHLRCGCWQMYHLALGWTTFRLCRRHDLLSDLGNLWRWMRARGWLKAAACGAAAAGITYLVFGGS